MLFPVLTVTHIVLVTAGYIGFIALNAWVLVLARDKNPSIVLAGLRAWRRLVRIFGPVLGLGVLAGFADAVYAGFSLTSLWLVGAYVLIVLSACTQAALMVPWQLRAEGAIARGETLSTRPIAALIALFFIFYVTITSLMFIRPV